MPDMKIKLGVSNGINVGVLGTRKGGGAAPTYSISGTVYDADGSTAVASATVALGALTATSAANGTYTISNIPAGTSGSMTCTKAGYSWTAISIAAMSGNLTGQNYTNAWLAAGGSLASNVAAYKSTGAASAAAAKVNIKNPGTYDLTDGTYVPTWNTATGWLFNSGDTNSESLRTGITTANGDGTWFIALTVNANTGGATNTMFGSYGSGNILIQRRDSADLVFINGNTITDTGNAITAGKHTLAIAGASAYKDGANVAGTMSKTASGIEIYLGALNFGGNAVQACGSYVTHFGYWSTPLNATQMAILHAAIP